MQIIYSPQFVKRYGRLDWKLKTKAEIKEKLFGRNPFDDRLRTHKLGGKFKNLWAFWVDYDCRIIFEFKSEKVVIFHSVGGHSIYK